MGCTSSRPAKPIPQPPRPTIKPRKHDASRLSRPFNPDIPLYQYDQPASHKANQTVRPVGPERYGDAYAQLNARSKPKRVHSVRPVGPERYGDAYAQLNARSKKTVGRKDQKVQFAQAPRVKSQAVKHFKGDTLYFAS